VSAVLEARLATRVAVAAVHEALHAPGSIGHVIFACFDRDVLAVYVAEGAEVSA